MSSTNSKRPMRTRPAAVSDWNAALFAAFSFFFVHILETAFLDRE